MLLTALPVLSAAPQAYLQAHAGTILRGHVLGGPLMVSDATIAEAAVAAAEAWGPQGTGCRRKRRRHRR